jgi:hypothetical protein
VFGTLPRPINPVTKMPFEKVELYVYRIMMLIILVYHFVKYLKFELMHW